MMKKNNNDQNFFFYIVCRLFINYFFIYKYVCEFLHKR